MIKFVVLSKFGLFSGPVLCGSADIEVTSLILIIVEIET